MKKKKAGRPKSGGGFRRFDLSVSKMGKKIRKFHSPVTAKCVTTIKSRTEKLLVFFRDAFLAYGFW